MSLLKPKNRIRKCLLAPVLVGLVICAQAVSATARTAKTIIFRSDDAQAYFSTDLLKHITDTLITNGIPQTIAVVPADTNGEVLGDDPVIVAYLNAIKTNPTVELALHGYQHTANEFGTLNLSDAEARIEAGLALINQALDLTSVTFIPPNNSFNTNTLTACKNKGFTRFSATRNSDPDTWAEAPTGLLHVSSTADFQDWDNGGEIKSSAAIIQEAQNSLNSNDVAVIQIHFWSFGDDDGNLDSDSYQTLLEVISWVRQKASEGVALMTIGQYKRNILIGLSGDLAFGSMTVETMATRTLTIRNIGNETLTVSGINYPGGFSGNWAGTIAGGGSINVTVTFAPAAVQDYGGTITVSSDTAEGTNTITCSGTGAAIGVVGPLITANGLVGDVYLNSSDPVMIAVQMMNIEPYLGVPVDWWIFARSGSTWIYMDSAAEWKLEDNWLKWHPVYQGGLFDLPATQVWNYSLPVGPYTFYFAIDYPMDGRLNGAIVVDSVNVTVQ
jgi:peptidoglycan/xylan/chitin deacetylase (PgdA/CDA1 family)